MAEFIDQTSLRFLDPAFIRDLVGDLGIETLFALSYRLPSAELRSLEIAEIVRRTFQKPIFETLRVRGSDARSSSPPERVQVDREQPRRGRLEWLDVLLELQLRARIHDQRAPLEGASSRSLLDTLGHPESFEAFRAALEARHGERLAAEMLERLKIRTMDDVRRKAGLLVGVAATEPAPYDPTDPASEYLLPLVLCIQIEPDLNLSQSLRNAKLRRSLLEHERNQPEILRGAEIRRPYVFLSIFPASVAIDDAVPGLSADEIKTRTRALFAAEEMSAHFLEAPPS